MPKLSEALSNFLQARKTPNNTDLINRWEIGMETQINVAADNGEPVDGKRSTYTDGEYTWFNIRVPKNAAGEPEFRDYELRWPLDLHVEGIGMTGWHWATRRSRWVAFDFDSLTSHAKGIGISNEELERVKKAAMAWPGAEIRKSTGGAGIHIYVYLDDIPTENHTVHAALARCVLGMMSSETGFDFASQIDCCGGNMWFHHRKMTADNCGLEIINPAEKKLCLPDLPGNWRDHIEVITRRRSKVRIHAELKDEYLDPFEALASARRVVPLDDTHKAIIDELTHSDFSTIWVPDHHLLQTHTCALTKLMKEKAAELKLQGIFQTISEGKDPGTPNCFMFPLDKGGWRVFRFSPGVTEAETWTQDKEGWTQCYFNHSSDSSSISTIFDRRELLLDAAREDDPPLIKLISCKELDTESFELEYLIKDVLLANQPCILGGPKKALKTSILVDLALSLTTTTPFLGRFSVQRPCEVVFFSGESGLAVLQNTARRVCQAKNLRLGEIENLNWSSFLPRFNNRQHLDAIEAVVTEKKCDVVIIDPAYLCMPGADAERLQSQGTLLRAINEVCDRNGAGLILAHHTKKSSQRQNSYRPPELDDLSWSGFAEFARQWMLLSRREDHVPGTGQHALWLALGGSAGHSSEWAVDIDEGVFGLPRYWDVVLSSPSEARAEKKSGTMRERILNAMANFPNGETKTRLLQAAKVRPDNDAQAVLDSLVDDGCLAPCKVKKGAATYPGFILAG